MRKQAKSYEGDLLNTQGLSNHTADLQIHS